MHSKFPLITLAVLLLLHIAFGVTPTGHDSRRYLEALKLRKSDDMESLLEFPMIRERDLSTRAPNQSANCPLAEDIAPCVCWDYGSLDLEMDCTFVTSEQELEQAFMADFPITRFGLFYMEDNPYIKNLGNILNGVSFRAIEIYNTPLEFISEYFLMDSFTSLSNILIVNTSLTTDNFPFLTLGNYQRLTSMILDQNDISWTPVLHSDSLTLLMLSHGNISEISVGKKFVCLNIHK